MGTSVYPILLDAARALLDTGRSLILEANFATEWTHALFGTLPPHRPVQVYCRAADEIMLARYVERLRSGTRHPAHGGEEILEELAETYRSDRDAPLDLDGPLFRLATDRFDDVDLGPVEAALASAGPPPDAGIPLIGVRALKEPLYAVFGRGGRLDDQTDAAARAIAVYLSERALAGGVGVAVEP